ncbi:hypothetical protein COW91_01460 [Candidatus Nomurabacteria bacterium CG22_combo_CG10-13_8_21_14_all_32_8]|uniref:VWFA domain-containing protein n=1 Tax=Candidatus Nomurabacteria bacterium CG22_combo_CG10-13_8_21_14_all_32_8 TaxID=1974732 RepID=A0A2H0CGJ9_9BACT|nr:MAG: hypothetical protein COW91_01460 [Candidatus Nomurabacteria bacterium CG22_combo_CG10-13_8_21_14_all_32_8]
MDNQTTNPSIQPQPPPIISATTPFNKTVFFVAGGFLFILMVTSLILFLGKKSSRQNETNNPTGKNNLFVEDLLKYDKDGDGDGYPDFIETAVGLDETISEEVRCQQNSCDVNLQTNSQKRNVLIILDASGSMDIMINGQKRMDLAKQAIKDYVSQSSTTTNVGLMIYGHKGSNSLADKAVSCATSEIIGQIGTVTSQNIDGILTPIKSTGWTLMGKAVNEAVNAFIGKQGQKNEIIIVTDGEETCDSDPVTAARNIKNSSLDVSVNVIGFAVDSGASSSLVQIANSGGGSFVTASNGEELDQKFKDLYQKGLQAYEFTKCKGSELETINKCNQDAYNRVDQYIQIEKKKYFDKSMSLNEYQRLSDLSSKLFKQLMSLRNNTLKKFQQSTDDVHDKAF